jgi:hypothetical protein
MTSALTRKIVLTMGECAVISQAFGQAVDLDRVVIADLREEARSSDPATTQMIMSLENLQGERASVMAKFTRATAIADAIGEPAVVLKLTQAEARTVVRAVLASVDFDDDRLSAIFDDSTDEGPGAEALRVHCALVQRNAARLASLQKLYAVAGINATCMPDAPA